MKRLFISIYFLLLTVSLLAQNQEYEFSHLNNTDGLSNNQVEHIFKDSRGFMWFATNMGLNRYDGVNFRTYHHFNNDPNSTPFDRYTQIQEDKEGNLWLLSNNNYAIYNPTNETFTRNVDSIMKIFGLPPNPQIIEIDTNKDFYVHYHKNGIYHYNTTTQTCVAYKQSSNPNHFSNDEIINIKIFKNYVWVLHTNGLIERLNKTTETVDLRNDFLKNKPTSTIRKRIYIDSKNSVWIYPGLKDSGCANYNAQSGEWSSILPGLFVRDIKEDQNGLLWIGTDHGGIKIYNKENGQIKNVYNDPIDNRSLSQNSAICLFCDDNGMVWVGTYKNGISYYHPNMFKFKEPAFSKLLRKDNIVLDCNSLLKDKNGYLWIGTNGKGLYRFDERTKQIKEFKHDPKNPNTISSEIITSILEDKSGKLWFGTFLGGLNSYSDSKFTHYKSDTPSNSLSNNSVYGIVEDQNENLWIGTLGGGVSQLDKNRSQFTHYTIANKKNNLSDYILSVNIDKYNNIYMCSDNGIGVLENEKISRISAKGLQQSMQNNALTNNSLVDSRNLLWIATYNGIIVQNKENESITTITTQNGLPNNEVVSLIEDDSNNIWAGTHNGLVKIEVKLSANEFSYILSSFNENDGLISPSFNQNAIFKDNNGYIYAGNTKGYVRFNPQQIESATISPHVKFTELVIANEIIKPNRKYNERIVLDKSITVSEKLSLNYNETNFSISFSAFNYIHPQKSNFRYMLEGLDSDWNYTTNGIGQVSYSNLSPGNYKLIIHTSIEDGVWNKTPLTLEITVNPRFWLSWWAYLIYLLIFLLFLTFFIRWKLNKHRTEFIQAQRILEAEKSHELNELKIRFFTNVSHEFKTPLTLIITPLEGILKKTISEKERPSLNIIHHNAQKLLNLVNDILDFRKLDLDKMTITYSKGDIISFVRNTCQSLSSLAESKSLNFSFTTYIDELIMDFDPKYMNKIVGNLLSNAIKYTEQGSIDISIAKTEILQNNAMQFISIKIADTGVGITEENISKIFDRFYRIESSSEFSPSGTGIGLHMASEYAKMHGGEIQVESRYGKGSTFTILIPLKKDADTKIETVSPPVDDNIIDKKEETENRSQNQNLPTLLIVDDNEDFCNFVCNLLVDDYKVITAYDGEEASKLVFEALPDIILSDIMMPKVDGYELCRIVKEDIRTSHIPIILLSAKSSEESKIIGLEAGADDYISKPFNIEVLKLSINRLVEQQKRVYENFRKPMEITPSQIEIKSKDEIFLNKAIETVEKNIDNPDFLVENLCKEMAMSRVYFYKKILALTDQSPSEFIRIIRLKRAADLLKKSQMYVNEVAYQVGFNDPKYFRKYFKEEFGITPSEYKNKHNTNPKEQ